MTENLRRLWEMELIAIDSTKREAASANPLGTKFAIGEGPFSKISTFIFGLDGCGANRFEAFVGSRFSNAKCDRFANLHYAQVCFAPFSDFCRITEIGPPPQLDPDQTAWQIELATTLGNDLTIRKSIPRKVRTRPS